MVDHSSCECKFSVLLSNIEKQPEKKQLPTASSLVVFYTNDFSYLVDKNTGSESEQW